MQIGDYIINPMIFVFIIATAGIIYWLYKERHKRAKVIIDFEHKIIAIMFCRNGKVRFLECHEDAGEVQEIQAPSGKLFSTDKSFKLGKESGVEMPANGSYFILPQMSYEFRYPLNEKPEKQITVRCAAYIEKMPLPIAAVNAEDWDDETYKQVTAVMLQVASNEKFAKALLESTTKILENWQMVVKRLKYINYYGIASIAGAAIGIIVFMNISGLNTKLDAIYGIVKLMAGIK